MSFEVDAERVQSAATATAGTSRNLVSEAQTMLRNLLALQECWRGSAAQNFQAVINQWEGAQKQLFESLDSIHGALNTAAVLGGRSRELASLRPLITCDRAGKSRRSRGRRLANYQPFLVG